MKHNAAVLGQFLRTRRRQLVRADLGLPLTSGRTTSGLRREEVAYLAGVSITWYTWLEQGRDVTPSRQVLDSLARTLRLSHTEHAYLLALAGYGVPHPTPDPSPDTVPADVARLLEAFADFPAMAVTTDWTVLAWNAAYAAVYPNIAKVAVADRNFLWLLFTDPFLRTLIPDWELTGMYNVASFRAEAGTRLDEPPFADLVGRLLRTSDAFRSAWESFDIDTMPSRERHFRHPEVGDLHMEQHILAPSDHPHLRLVTFIPVADSDTAMKMRSLREHRLASPMNR
ncbi:helix-turn-helix transcriptional regulator [Mycolicibacterium tusciae]|uniref:helix-turn-helix transcriptional regulator n=1 Tax=Mycolicibacterium tusciae TaxID=75922 RepID=UPI00024A4AE6